MRLMLASLAKSSVVKSGLDRLLSKIISIGFAFEIVCENTAFWFSIVVICIFFLSAANVQIRL